MNLRTLDGRPDGLPLVIQPEKNGARGTGDLLGWIDASRDLVTDLLRHHGALLFRGFSVEDAPDFEKVALAVEPKLENEYLGTSPRNALTRYVFSASELPGYYPIPQHCEMTFLAQPPRRLFFCCLIPSTGVGGETPLVDFRRVQADLDPEVRERFVARGVRIIRNYTGPDGGGGRFNVFQLKRWDEMFLTTDRAIVEEKCRQQGFQTTWLPGGRLRLVSDHAALRTHPETGVPVWHNHVQVFHLGAGAGEYRRIWRDRHDLRSLALWSFTRAMTFAQKLKPAEERSMHCTYSDGEEIPDADMEHLRDVIWKHMVRFKWQKSDVVAIDNFAVSHGRMPYTGPRQIVVAWA